MTKSNMMTFIRRIVSVLSLGYVFFYFSELLFWARLKPEDTGRSLLFTWLVYSFMAYLFILIVEYGKIRTRYGLFLAGLVFGWVAEGLVVYTMYDAFPFQIAWTGMAWHALLSVVLGISLMKTMMDQTVPRIVFLTVCVGLFFGFWSVWWKLEDGFTIPFFDNVLYWFLSTCGLVVAFVGYHHGYPRYFKASRGEIILLVVITAAFVLAAIIEKGETLLILPLAISIPVSGILINLKRYDHDEKYNSILVPNQGRVTARILLIFLIPVMAILVYEMMRGIGLETHYYVAAVTVTISIGAAFSALVHSLGKSKI